MNQSLQNPTSPPFRRTKHTTSHRAVRSGSAAVASLAVALALFFVAAPASALTVVAHAYGHLSTTDGSWIGSHRLGDGNVGFCLQIEKLPPEGSDVTYDHGSTLGWYSRDDAARLAFLARTSVLTTDPIEASAAQLAAWTITGLGTHDDAYYAQRANGDAAAVLARARELRAAMDGPGGASHGVTARVTLAPPPNTGKAGATVRSDLLVDFLSGGVTTLPSGEHTGTMTLSGATFDDGSSVMAVQNGQQYAVHPIGGAQTTHVTASVVFTELRYGDDFWVAKAPATVQTLLVQQPRQSEAHASASYDVASDLPFYPAVETTTSAKQAVPGDVVHDDLELRLADAPIEQPARTGPDRLDHWGTYVADDGSEHPIPVTVQSTLRGPFDTLPKPGPAAPDGSGVVCTVEVLVDRGPGSYSTPACVLPAAGYYVWTEIIDPAKTPPEQGGARVRPWASPFGAAAETTQVTPPPVSPPPTLPPTVPPTVPPLPPVQPPVVTPPPVTPEVTPTPALPRTLASTGSTSLPVWGGWAAILVLGGGLGVAIGSNHERFHRRRR